MITPHPVDSRFVVQCMDAESLGMGMLFAAMFRDKFLFSHASQEWYVYRDHYWELDYGSVATLGAVDMVAQRCAEEIAPIEDRIAEHRESKNDYQRKAAEKEKKRIIDIVRSLRRKAGRADCLHFAATLPGEQGLGIKGDSFDQNIWIIGVLNGVINLRTHKFRPGRPGDMLTKVCPIVFDTAAKCPKFLAFLESSLQPDDIELLQTWDGYMLTGSVEEHCYVVNIGAGRNGKSTHQDIISAVLGPYSVQVKAELVLDQGRSKSASGPSPEIMSLYGARAVWVSETGEGRKLDKPQVKLLTGGGKLNGRNPNDKYEVCFDQTHKLNLDTNEPPAMDGDFAIEERQRTIVWENSFVDNPRKPNERLKIKGLAEDIKAHELPGVFNWMLEGNATWQRNRRLSESARHRQSTKDMARETDVVQDFIDQCCWTVDDDSVRTSATELYVAWDEWYKKYHGRHVPGMKFFGGRMKKKFERIKAGSYYYVGIGLLSQ